MNEISKCCKKLLKVYFGDENTNCYICSECNKPTNIWHKIDEYSGTPKECNCNIPMSQRCACCAHFTDPKCKQPSVNSGEVEKEAIECFCHCHCDRPRLRCGSPNHQQKCSHCQPEQKAEDGEWEEEFTKRFIQGHGPIPNGANDIQESDSWIEASPEEMKTFIRNLIQSRESQIREKIKPVIDLVNQQAEDEGLWFVAKTAPEAYLQKELRKLHAVIEDQILNNSPL